MGNDEDDEDEDEEDYDESQEDRPYTMEEIKTMFNAAQDIRVKIVISLLSSSGIRHGAIPNMKLKNLERNDKYNNYKITVYRRSKKSRYYTFCSVECRNLIDSYLEYRKNNGENLNDNSPFIREQFNTNDRLKVNRPRHLTSKSFRKMINDVLTKYTDLRKKLPFDRINNTKEGRNPTKLTHSFRKFFTVECTKVDVYHEIVERLCGRKIPGSRNNYLLLNPDTLLEGTKDMKGYINAIDALTINEENKLRKENSELKEDLEQKYNSLQQRLAEKDQQINSLNKQVERFPDQLTETLNFHMNLLLQKYGLVDYKKIKNKKMQE